MIRLYNALVMPMGADCSYFCGEVWTDADRIAYVGPERGGERPAFERRSTSAARSSSPASRTRTPTRP